VLRGITATVEGVQPAGGRVTHSMHGAGGGES
jgi:hypothetical protein